MASGKPAVTDRELEHRFNRHFSAIDAEIPATSAFPKPAPRTASSSRRLVAIAAAAIAIVVIGVPMVAPIATTPPASMTPGPIADASRQPDAVFPKAAFGLPVVSVARALDLLQAGRLDGRAVAVAGYFDAFYPHCPPTRRYVGPLERWCGTTSSIADSAGDARLCTTVGCHWPTGVNLAPFSMPETAGLDAIQLGAGDEHEPIPLVVIGHAGDLRQWQCTPDTQDACADGFVIDRVAWAAGHEVPLEAPETGDFTSGEPITPATSLDDVLAVTGLGDQALTAAPFRAGDLGLLDPRLSVVAGDGVVWLIRTLGEAAAPGDETRPELTWIVGEGSATVPTAPFQGSDPGYLPGRLWPQATVLGEECCSWDPRPYLRIESDDGVVDEGVLGAGASGSGTETVYGAGAGTTPFVLPAGTYTVTAWLASSTDSAAVQAGRTCSMRMTLQSLDNIAFDAGFPQDGPCTFGTASAPSASATP